MKLSHLVAGAFGITGFVLSVLAGLMADNGVESILLKASFFLIVCYAVEYFVGLIGQQVSSEHAVRLAKMAADLDKAEEQKRLEDEAAKESEAAQQAADLAATQAAAQVPVPVLAGAAAGAKI